LSFGLVIVLCGWQLSVVQRSEWRQKLRIATAVNSKRQKNGIAASDRAAEYLVTSEATCVIANGDAGRVDLPALTVRNGAAKPAAS
jgi:hypothetical protein